jgi:hypothetical protein
VLLMFTLIPSPTCPRCTRSVFEGDEQVVCEGCLATHHTRCWHQGEGCSALRAPVSEPPPELRPPKIRVKRQTWEAGAAGVAVAERRRALVTSLGVHEEPAEAVPETAFQPPALLPHRGEERKCDKCMERFVVSDPLERRCKRCVYGTYWKIGLMFAVIVIWKLIF